jgi:hypothetical protein
MDDYRDGPDMSAQLLMAYGGGLAPDPFWSDVSLLLRFHGPNNGTTFTDDSAYAHSITRTGAVISTAQSMFGGSSALFDGVDDYLSIPSNASLSLNAIGSTVEGFARCTNASGNVSVIDFRGTGAFSVSWILFLNAANRTISVYDGTINSTVMASSNNAIPASGTWFHWAVDSTGTAATLYVNGASVASAGSWSMPATHSTGIRIGVNQATADDFAGNMDNIRITRARRYTAGFTTPDAEFPNY